MMNRDCESRSDIELVAATLKKKEAFTCIVERYEKKIERYVRRITNVTSEDAQDILQEIFIKVYMNLNDFDTSLSFSSWVYRIAHNTVISNHRKRSVRPEGHSVDLDDDILLSMVDDIDIETRLDQQFLREQLMEALSKIGETNREVLILRFFEEKDYHEISDIMQKPMGTVATLLNRSKKKLKEAFISLGYSQQDYEK